MSDITELAQSLKAAAIDAKELAIIARYSKGRAAAEKFYALANPANILALVEALEKAQGMETYWKTQCRGITDHCEELQARIAELESHTVKPPVHPTVASEKLDDETLQELIEFRRTTFEYHSKEGNKVQTIIHGVTLSALRELQERRKAPAQELNPASLANKFYERYPLATFKSDSERAEAFGYFMAGAELQCFGEFIKYEDLCGDE
ncbi:Ead domain protein [Klebsiella pneumoniae]|uniref:hypothetical protein n=1 Tax=Klebsiella pneumoniae TaxID=573 RepID=UPI000E2A50B2|nr:hypothetical protein [Klebsiella pneumoniae]SYF02450.1 Ead domain protein [Klebsiella pneumoniae]